LVNASFSVDRHPDPPQDGEGPRNCNPRARKLSSLPSIAAYASAISILPVFVIVLEVVSKVKFAKPPPKNRPHPN
jgi:hypothetical protein